MIAQDIIRAASDEHRRGVLVGQFRNDLALRQKDVILRQSLGFGERGIRPLNRNIEQERIGHALLVLLNELGRIAALIGGQVDELSVKDRQLQPLTIGRGELERRVL